jgi:hypothetical protein
MHRIDSDGATVNNQFTEGSAVLSIPATVVSAAIANAWQEEIATVIEGAGITLLTSLTDTWDQLDAAIKKLIQTGGNVAALAATIANNQASLADVANFPQQDVTIVKALEVLYRLLRRTDSGYLIETGRLYLTWNPETTDWEVTKAAYHGDSEVDFSMTLVAGNVWKLQYQSSDLVGASYAGTMNFTDIKEVR